MTRFKVKNYKCLADIDIPLTPIHVLIGQNDAGKTSLLEAMLAFYRSSVMELKPAFPGKWEGTDLVFENADQPLIQLGGAFANTSSIRAIEYGFNADFALEGRVIKKREWFADASNEKPQDLEIHNPNGTNVYHRTQFDQNERKKLSMVADGLGPAHLYRFDPKLMALPATIDPQRKFRMDPDGFGLAGLLDDILSYKPELFIHVRDRFCQYFPQFRSVHLEIEQAANRNYQEAGISIMTPGAGKGIWFETRRGRSIRAQQASDGAILFLGFLALVNLPEPPKLLLIEEPEKGVYPKRLDEIVGLLKEAIGGGANGSRPQVVISTHSPYMLSFFKPEEVTVMSRLTDGSVRARPLRDAPNIEERMAGEFFLGELWYNLTEEELFGDVQPQNA
ncbi:MAG TPA: AAA family ATPase [Gemmataceae bacterium]|nr:AAA family ATPase [Gemmataceae bacterium]